MRARWTVPGMALVILGAVDLAGAQVGKFVLKPANATHPEEFDNLVGVRELTDGRLLVSDRGNNRIVVLDFASGSLKQVSRTGKGPGEYTSVTTLRPMGGDSTLMVDLFSQRWLILHSDSVVLTVSKGDKAVDATESMIFGAAVGGHVLREFSKPPTDGASVVETSDSSAVTLISRVTGKVDTVARVRPIEMRRQVNRNAAGVITMSSTMPVGPMRGAEQSTLFEDGWLAIARIEPFRVDWRAPDGTWTKGAPLPVARIRVNKREIDAFDARQAAAAAAQPPRPPRPPGVPGPSDIPRDFPEFMPAFTTNSAMQGPLGTLILRRPKSADFPDNHYLVIDRRGRFVGQIDLPAAETIIGAGARTIYTTIKDQDDILHLRRHPW